MRRDLNQKAPVNRTHSRRFAPLQGTSGAAERLECGDSSPLFGAGSSTPNYIARIEAMNLPSKVRCAVPCGPERRAAESPPYLADLTG